MSKILAVKAELRDLITYGRRPVIPNGIVQHSVSKTSVMSYGNRKLWKPKGEIWQRGIKFGKPNDELYERITNERLMRALEAELPPLAELI